MKLPRKTMAVMLALIAATLITAPLFHAPTTLVSVSPVVTVRRSEPAAEHPTPVDLVGERQRLDQTVWSKEVAAQEHERPIIALWDAMRSRIDDAHLPLADYPVGQIAIRAFAVPQQLPWACTEAEMVGDELRLDQQGWHDLVQRLAADGYRLEHEEFHQASFDLNEDGSARSRFTIKLFATQPQHSVRLVVSGTIEVSWSRERDARGFHVPLAIDATGLTVTARKGEDAFTESFHISPAEAGVAPDSAIEPVMIADPDRDGRPDILLPSLNLLLRNHVRDGRIDFVPEALCRYPISVSSMESGPFVSAAVHADFTGDGSGDLLVCGPGLPPHLFIADTDGRFMSDALPVANIAPSACLYPVCMTCADIDGDGDLDVWIGQYRRAYEDGNLPNPYWDANDGYPSFLLRNDGGRFTDITSGSGLALKRNRRNYSASFVDLDGDGRPEVVTVNDFSGVDVFGNLGHGRFSDITTAAIDERANFGMSLAIADFDGDGKVDLFVSGMGSTTARRLEAMHLGRAEFPEHQRMRMKMGYGNRLYLGDGAGKLTQASFNDDIARTGWSWGCTVIDPANDGRPGLFVANGYLSRGTAKDYCTRYWTHDIYDASKKPSELEVLFTHESDGLLASSWNPFEHKALLLNDGTQFRNLSYPMALGFEWDGRGAVSADFDGDGREDLAVVEAQAGNASGPAHSVLHVLQNHLPDTGHWLTVRLEDAPHAPAMGATITVHAGGHAFIAVVVSGDSFRAQHGLSKHFGLGALDQVDAVEVTWSGGRTTRLAAPPIDTEVLIRPGPGR